MHKDYRNQKKEASLFTATNWECLFPKRIALQSWNDGFFPLQIAVSISFASQMFDLTTVDV